jgi:aspartyl aminopeptidase
MMSHILADFKAFLDRSPTSWHAVTELGNRFADLDFTPLEEQEPWQLEKGKKYFVIRGGAMCAFSLPKEKPSKMKIIAAHTDSPALKLKPRPEIRKENMTTLGVEVYGGPMLSSWLNRDLAIAGRIIVADSKGERRQHLVCLDDALLVIPQLAIHLDKEINEKGFVLNKQDHLCPILGLGPEPENLELLLRRHIPFQSLLSFDLFLTPVEEARFLGASHEMIASYRIDNLTSAHACATAIASAKPHNLQMAIFWDHEEVGSKTAEGAASPFLSDILERIALAYPLSKEELIRMKQNSLCASVDVAHGFNPNYANKYDAQHLPLLGAGIVIKYNADQKYATNAETAADIVQICQDIHLKYQPSVARSDIPGGSTVGPVVAQTLGIPTVDIGIPQLSMHSTREVMACQDHLDMCHLLTHVLER